MAENCDEDVYGLDEVGEMRGSGWFSRTLYCCLGWLSWRRSDMHDHYYKEHDLSASKYVSKRCSWSTVSAVVA